MRGTVCIATSRRYARAWLVWCNFCGERDLSGNELLTGLTREKMLRTLVHFIYHRRVVKMDTFGVVNGYLTGIRFEFKCHFAEIKVLKDPVVVHALAAARDHVTLLDKERKLFVRYPIPYEAVRNMEELSIQTIDGRAKYTASELAFHLLMRVGEYTINGKKCTHTLMGSQVLLDTSTEELINIDDFRIRQGQVAIVGVMVLFKGDKTHKKHKETFHYISGEGHEDGAERHLVGLLLEWIRLSKVKLEDPFFTRYAEHPKSRRVLTSRDITEFLNDAAVMMGLEKGVFKPHSQRSGGAMELCQSGVNSETINHAGRWADGSIPAVGYRKREDRRIGALSNIIGKVGSFSVKDMLSVKLIKKKNVKVDSVGSSLMPQVSGGGGNLSASSTRTTGGKQKKT